MRARTDETFTSKHDGELPELALIAGTRAILGIGIGLLLADRLNSDQRKAVGWTMFSIGAISTIPLAFEVFGGERPTRTFRTGEDHLRTGWR